MWEGMSGMVVVGLIGGYGDRLCGRVSQEWLWWV